MKVDMYRHIKYHGVDVTVTNYTETGTDSYGDPVLSETVRYTKAIVDVDTSGERKYQTISGQNVLVPAAIWLVDCEPIYDSDDGDFPTEITAGGKSYEVILKDGVNNNGVTHTICRRI